MVKNLSTNSGNMGSIPRLGRFPEKEMVTHSSILACKIPWTRSLVGYGPWGCKRSLGPQQILGVLRGPVTEKFERC